MKPTATRGICGSCQEPNPYTATNCVRCNARLAWAFLIDGKEDESVATPVGKFFNRLFGASERLCCANSHEYGRGVNLEG